MTNGGSGQFNEDWASQSPLREPSAAERDWAAKRRRWAALDAAEQEQQAARRTTVVRANRRARLRRLYPWLVFAAIAVVLITVSRISGIAPGSLNATSDVPPPGVGEHDQRIHPPSTPPKSSEAYNYSERNPDGTPVTFSPCRVWPVVVNLTGAPPDAYQAVNQALGQIDQATGLALTLEGPTTETAATKRDEYQPGRYGQRWAPILITWSTGAVDAGFAGHGGPSLIRLPNGQQHYVTGQVTLDANGQFITNPERLNAILLHELGHVVGLDHSPDPTELMAPENTGQTAFGPGDLTGLATLGNGPCTSTI